MVQGVSLSHISNTYAVAETLYVSLYVSFENVFFFLENFGQKMYLYKAEHYFLNFFATKLELKVDLIEKSFFENILLIKTFKI